MPGPTAFDSGIVEAVDAELWEVRRISPTLCETSRSLRGGLHGDAMRHSVTDGNEYSAKDERREVETMTKERTHILDELERFHLGRLDEIRVKRGYATLDGSRPIVIDGSVNLKIDPTRKELVVSWGK
jgi:hypothetical protein